MSVEPDKSKTGFMANTPEQNAKEAHDQLITTPEQEATSRRLADKDTLLTEFQESEGVSDKIAEAAIKEWVMTNDGNFDWKLEDVKTICLRNKRDGIPNGYLSESDRNG